MKTDLTRRQFLRRTAGAAGAATIAPKLLTDPNPIPYSSYVPPSDRVRFGIIGVGMQGDRKSTRLNSSHSQISYAVFCLKKKKKIHQIYSRKDYDYCKLVSSQLRPC